MRLQNAFQQLDLNIEDIIFIYKIEYGKPVLTAIICLLKQYILNIVKVPVFIRFDEK